MEDEVKTHIPKFLKFATGFEIRDINDSDLKHTDLENLPQHFCYKRTEVQSKDLGGKSMLDTINVIEELSVYNTSDLNKYMSDIEENFVRDLKASFNPATVHGKVDVSSTYRRKKELLDKRRKMALEAGDNELIELLKGNNPVMIAELDKEILVQVGTVFSKMMLGAYNYVVVSPEMAAVLKELTIFNQEKPDLINITTIVPEGNISNIMVFSDMMTSPDDKWNMYFSSSVGTQKHIAITQSATSAILYTKTTKETRYDHNRKKIQVIGADVERTPMNFMPSLDGYTMRTVEVNGTIRGVEVDANNPFSKWLDPKGDIYPGLRSS